MRHPTKLATAIVLAALTVTGLHGCAGGPRLEARPQTITFGPAPTPAVNQPTATVVAASSSGLPVLYGTRTPVLCSVDANTGVVTAVGLGPLHRHRGTVGRFALRGRLPGQPGRRLHLPGRDRVRTGSVTERV